MPTILDSIVENKLCELTEKKRELSLSDLVCSVKKSDNDKFTRTLSSKSEHNSVKLILEIKPASPSDGVLAKEFRLEPVLECYNRYATAISVLTDHKFFSGSLDLLKYVVKNSSHPVLCKDFIIDPYQVYEARLAGADAILLITKILTDIQLYELYKLITDLGMAAVIEVQNREELNRALSFNPKIILINNRNLDTFEISLDTTLNLAPEIPENILVISASGINNRQDIESILSACSNFLIGSVLMRISIDLLPKKLEELAKL